MLFQPLPAVPSCPAEARELKTTVSTLSVAGLPDVTMGLANSRTEQKLSQVGRVSISLLQDLQGSGNGFLTLEPG